MSCPTSCYYLKVINNRYWFSLTPNLNKLLTDRRATIKAAAIEERVKQVIQEVFKVGPVARSHLLPREERPDPRPSRADAGDHGPGPGPRRTRRRKSCSTSSSAITASRDEPSRAP